MSEGVPYADIVILALIAGFILLRLRNVLGTRNDGESHNYFNKITPPSPEQQEPIVQLDEKSIKPKPKEEPDKYLSSVTDEDLAKTLSDIKAKDMLFSATRFLEGAKGAYEMVFDAFIKGDRQTLKMLLSDALFQEFAQELDNREKQENKTETTLVSVQAKDIVQAVLDKNMARLTVSFESEQVTVVRNGEGEIIEGNPSDIANVEDKWVFERDVTSRNPNWKIIET